MAGALAQLRQHYQASRGVEVGHSSGAAITANVLAQYPACVDAALLVCCPCDVPRWRQHMLMLPGGPMWQARIRSVSPQALVAGVSQTVTNF